MKSSRSRLVCFWPALATAVLLEEGCGGAIPVESLLVVGVVEVSPAEATLRPTHQRALSAAARTTSGIPLTGRTVSWASTQPLVAAVDDEGVVRGVSPGTARITATVDGVVGAADVTITLVRVDQLDVSPSSTSVIVGGTTQLTATAYDNDDNVLTGREIVWSSSQPGVASVSPEGLVTGLAPGTATITAASEGRTDKCTVTVVAGAAPSVRMQHEAGGKGR